MLDLEFHTAYGKVAEHLIDEVRKEILSLSYMNREISRTEVVMKCKLPPKFGQLRLELITRIDY